MPKLITYLSAGVCAMLLAYTPSPSEAQEFPQRDLSIIVPFTAGGQTDIAGRLFADAFGEVLGRTVTVVNRPGAGGTIGAAEMATLQPDGYRLGIVTSTPLVQAPNINEMPYSIDDFEYICRVYHNPLMFVVKIDSDLERPSNLVEMVQAGEQVLYSSSGPGSVQHLAMMHFDEVAGVQTTHVPGSSDADNIRSILAGVITGHLTPPSVARANSDTVKPIGVMNTERVAAYPDVPTFGEEGYDVTAAIWGVLVGPKGMPEPVVARLREVCAEAQQTEEFERRLRELGMDPAYLDGPEVEQLVQAENEIAARLLREAGLAQ